MRIPHYLGDVLVKSHPRIGVNVGVDQCSRDQVDELSVFRAKLGLLLIVGCHADSFY